MEGLEKYMDDANLESLGAQSDVESESVSTGSDDQGSESSQSVDATLEGNDKDQETSVADKLDKLESGQADQVEVEKLIDYVNGLGILRKGLPVEIENADQLKEFLSKGADYTYKSQEREKEFESKGKEYQEREQMLVQKEQELESYKAEVQTELLANEVMGQIIQEIQVNDPELFADIAGKFSQRMGAYNQQMNSPVVGELQKKIQTLEERLNGQGKEDQTKQLATVKQDWEKGLGEVQSTYAVKLKSLGIKPNWADVQKDWMADPTNSKSVKDIFFAKYGEQITKALDAKAKLAQTKQQSAARLGTAAKQSTEVPTARGHGDGSYMKDLEKIAQKYA